MHTDHALAFYIIELLQGNPLRPTGQTFLPGKVIKSEKIWCVLTLTIDACLLHAHVLFFYLFPYYCVNTYVIDYSLKTLVVMRRAFYFGGVLYIRFSSQYGRESPTRKMISVFFTKYTQYARDLKKKNLKNIRRIRNMAAVSKL